MQQLKIYIERRMDNKWHVIQELPEWQELCVCESELKAQGIKIALESAALKYGEDLRVHTDKGVLEKMGWRVWAFEVVYWTFSDGPVNKTVAVSARSASEALRRLVSRYNYMVKRCELISGRKPQYDQCRIEGFVDYEIQNQTTIENLEYL